MISEPERDALERAVALAARGLGSTSPNPVVGCLILDRDGSPVGEGFHARAGGPHAEVVALAAAGERSRGGTAVVTLEPCRTTGRTGPCTLALRVAGITRVVFAVADPTEAGGGAAELRAAGLDVVQVTHAPARRVNEAWLHAAATGRPFVIWKTACTLDGRVAAADGSSRWITGQQAREQVHELRSQVDAVLIGSGTALEDDPQLTARSPDGAPLGRQPLRVVLDRSGRVPAAARVRDDSAPTAVLDAPDPPTALSQLWERGVRSVLLEGGPSVAAAFWRADCVDKVVAYLAPALLGEGPGVLADLGVGTISAARRLVFDDVSRVGEDLRVVAYPSSEE